MDEKQEQFIKDKNREILSGTSFSFSGNIFGKVVNFIFQIVIARILGPNDLGIFALGESILRITKKISSLGIDLGGIIKYVTVYEAKKDQRRLRGVILGGFGLAVGSSLIFLVLLYLVAPWLADHLFHQEELADILRIFAISLPFHVFLMITAAVAQALRDMKFNALLLSGVLPIANLSAVIMARIFNLQLVGLVLCISGMMGVSFFVSLSVLSRLVSNRIKNEKAIFNFNELLKISLPAMVVSVTAVVFWQSDKLVLGIFGSSTDVGIFSVASRLVWTIQLVVLSFGIFPSFIAELFEEGKLQELEELFSNVIRWVFIMMYPIFLLIMLYPKIIMGIFGSNFIEGWPILIVLAFSPLITSLTAMSSQMLRMTGYQKTEAYIGLLSMILNLSLSIFLVMNFGVFGVALGTVITALITDILKMRTISKKLDIQPYDSRMWRPFWIGTTSAAATYLVKISQPFNMPWLELAFELTVFIAIFIILGFLLLPQEDKYLIKRIFSDFQIKVGLRSQK